MPNFSNSESLEFAGAALERAEKCRVVEVPELDAAVLFTVWEEEVARDAPLEGNDDWAADLDGRLEVPGEQRLPTEGHPPKRFRQSNGGDDVGGLLKNKKQMKRDDKAEKRWQECGHLPRPATVRKYASKAKITGTNFKINTAPSKAGGYSARHRTPEDFGRKYTLKEAQALGLTLVPFESYDRPFVDKRGRILAVIVPPPDDARYRQSTNDAFSSMMDVGDNTNFKKDFLKHKRGKGFAAINVGISYGNGHTKPSRPDLGQYKHAAAELLEDDDIQRLAAFQDASFAFWHPKGYRYYKKNLDALWKHHPELNRPIFRRSILPTVAFNIGRSVCTFKHVDSQNCPFGWCCVTALGNFDHTEGGHIILWDLGLILEFPAGACVCLPSALIMHSNIAVREGDQRASFTQYCPGEVFRYIENGFCTDAALKKKTGFNFDIHALKRETRLRNGYELFSSLSSIRLGQFYG